MLYSPSLRAAMKRRGSYRSRSLLVSLLVVALSGDISLCTQIHSLGGAQAQRGEKISHGVRGGKDAPTR